jgi:hypothetical protein
MSFCGCQASPVQWTTRHVEGHQDDSRAIHSLDHWGQLNCQADSLAKEHISIAKMTFRHYYIYLQPWAVWYNRRKLQNLSEIHDIVHSKQASSFCAYKENTDNNVLTTIDWASIGSALRRVPHVHHLFVSKLTVGICGVGKRMHRWKLWPENKCPRCGKPEDRTHVLLCRGEGADAI